MDRSELESAPTSAQYLAGQLSKDAASAFEDAYARDPEIVSDLERTLRLKEGLAILRERGELSALLRSPPRHQRFVRVAAMTLVVVLIGSAFWQRARILNFVWPVPAMSADNRRSAQVLDTYILVRTRESSTVMEIPLQLRTGVIELRILPSAFALHGRYIARLARHEATGDRTLGEMDTLVPGFDHFVTIYISAERLTRGDYDLFLAPVSTGSAIEEIDQFTLRVN